MNLAQHFGGGFDLAWGRDEEDEKRLLISQFIVLLPMLLLAVTLPLLPSFDIPEEIKPIEEPPERIAKLLVKEPPPPPPPPPPPQPRAEAVAPKPTPAPKVTPKEVKPKPAPAPAPRPRPAPPRPTAAEQAANALRGADEALSTFKRQDIATRIESDKKLSGATGAADDNAGAVIAADATQGSGGIGEDRNVIPSGNTQLAQRQTTSVASGTASGNSSGTSGGGNSNRSGAYVPERSTESIQLVIDRNKNAFDRLYSRALRNTPDLNGVVVLRFTIAPSGKVTSCSIVSSELNNPELENKLVSRFKLLDFGAQDVPAITATKPLSFYPR